jgi:exopolysaccharide biosynthesis polyprenyl glycosylphosphotransferase
MAAADTARLGTPEPVLAPHVSSPPGTPPAAPAAVVPAVPVGRRRWSTAHLRDLGLAAVAAATGVTSGLAGASIPVAIGVGAVAFAAFSVAGRDRGEFAGAFAVRAMRMVFAATLLFLAAAMLFEVAGMDVSLWALAAAAGGAGLLAVAWDQIVGRRVAGRRPLRIVAVGRGRAASRLSLDFLGGRPRGFELVGAVADTAEDEGDEPLACPLLGTLADLGAVVAEHQVDAIVLASPTGRLQVLEQVLALPEPPGVLELSDVYERAFGRVSVEGINAAWFLQTLDLHRRPNGVRRALESVAALLGLVFVLPILLVVAVAVKLDSRGPVFYRQYRVGEGGRHFSIVKFRSMRVDAEQAGAQWASQNDPRVTRVGRILRKYRIDELPQLWNVVRGDMAIVGPRPERPEFVVELAREIPFFEPRHLVRPGVTGWAQVYAPYGASADDALAKLSYDLYYLKNGSIATDLGIMLRTAGVMVGGVGSR